jgi:hypothetical protein
MTDAEKAVEIQACKDLEKDLLALLDAEIEKVPDAYKPMVKAIWAPMELSIKSFIDTKIAAL